MSGKWVGYLERHGDDLVPHVVAYDDARKFGHQTRKAALSALWAELERDHKAARAKVAETGRALANLLELEHEK